MKRTKVLAIDDSAVARQLLKAMAEPEPDLELDTAPNGVTGLRKLESGGYDVVILDLEMPGLSGLEVLQEINATSRTPVVVCSSVSPSGRSARMALDLGARDFVSKPTLSGGQVSEDSKSLIFDAVRAAHVAADLRSMPAASLYPLPESARTRSVVVALGLSTGGPVALDRLLPRLPKTCPPVLIVQHMAQGFTRALAERLNDSCAVAVQEARDGQIVSTGNVYIAPGGCHMRLVGAGGQNRISVSQGPLVKRHRPSVDVLFRSVAKCAGSRAVGVIMTGMGDDGAEALGVMRKHGAVTLAQDKSSCAVYGMPKVAVELGSVERVVSLEDMAAEILNAAECVARGVVSMLPPAV